MIRDTKYFSKETCADRRALLYVTENINHVNKLFTKEMESLWTEIRVYEGKV